MDAAATADDKEKDLELGGVEFAIGTVTLSTEGLDPRTVEEAQQRLDWLMWEEVMKKELDVLKAAETWEVIEQPQGRNVVGCKWVFCIKKDM